MIQVRRQKDRSSFRQKQYTQLRLYPPSTAHPSTYLFEDRSGRRIVHAQEDTGTRENNNPHKPSPPPTGTSVAPTKSLPSVVILVGA